VALGLCAAAGAALIALAADTFTLAWTHSVERIEWREQWRVEGGALRLVESRVQGSGAGMEPPDGARGEGRWWVAPDTMRVAQLRLARSGAVGSGWRVCVDGAGCLDLERALETEGAEAGAGPVVLSPGRCPGTPGRSWP
jgi:hypothetical protein